MKVFFSDFFDVSPERMKAYGTFNISLINDLPVFIDPFLLFSSPKPEYQALHDQMIDYLAFLRDLSQEGTVDDGMMKHLFQFPEVRENWLGFSLAGNRGAGPGRKFAKTLNIGLARLFTDVGQEQVTLGNHLEKLCLIQERVGKDNISDFTTNLIKGYLCEYTQTFAKAHIDPRQLREVQVKHAVFNQKLRRWESRPYTLPFIHGAFVLLTPRDILTKDDTWISREGLMGDFDGIIEALPNDVLRSQVSDYFRRQVPTKPKRGDVARAKSRTLLAYPQLIDRFIRMKEDHPDSARRNSADRLDEVESMLVRQVAELVDTLRVGGIFYGSSATTLEGAAARIAYLKTVIEDNDGYRIFYGKNGVTLSRETDLHVMFRLTRFAASEDLNAEVNNGRGPVDFKVSKGAKDKTLVEFKLARNTHLEPNLAKQVDFYKAANDTESAITVIVYFTESEFERVARIFKNLGLKEGPHLVLIDARRDNKPSASKAA